MQNRKNVLFYTIDYLDWGEHMKIYGQYNKLIMRIMVIILPALMLNLINTGSEENTGSQSGTGREASDSFTNISKPLYYLNYYTAIALLPEEETAAVHFIRSAARYYQYPQRFFPSDAIPFALPLFNIVLTFYLFLNLFTKRVDNTTELAHHTGGHAPPALCYS